MAKALRTYSEVNEKIKKGTAVVLTAEEVIDLVDDIGLEEAAKQVDVVTTATFGPMCSSGAFINFGHSDPPIRMEKITLNKVEAYGGLAAVDTYIGATQESSEQGYTYGGAHVICDLVDGKSVQLQAKGKGTDCYPNREVERSVTLEDLNEAYLFNPRNCYQNYNAAINGSEKTIYTYMGPLKPNFGNVTYSTAGQLSPLLNDPTYRTIGVGTRILIGGAVGYVSWRGTQFNSAAERDETGVPKTPSGTLALVGDLKQMDTAYLRPGVFKGYGCSLYVGVGIPIPVLDLDILKNCAIRDEEIETNVIDYSVPYRSKPAVTRVSYAELKSGSITVNGQTIKTSPLTSLKKSRAIAKDLKNRIQEGTFTLQEPIELFDTVSKVKPMTDKGGA